MVSDPSLDSAFIPYPRSDSRKTSPALNIFFLVAKTQMGIDFPHLFLSWAGGGTASTGMEGSIGAGRFYVKWRDLREKAG